MHTIEPGIYQHYKGGLYEVLATGCLEVTLEEVIIYKSLYDAPDFPKGTIWVRPAKSFFEEIETKEGTRPRFIQYKPQD